MEEYLLLPPLPREYALEACTGHWALPASKLVDIWDAVSCSSMQTPQQPVAVYAAPVVLPGKPREAIDMYIHTQDWDAAMRVAEQCDPTAVMDIFSAQATAAAAANQYQFAETLFLKAKRPEAALNMYKEAGQWQAAIRLAEAYLPGKLQVL